MAAPHVAPIRVLIADDHSVVREGLASIIRGQEDMVLVGNACDGSECIRLWREEKPDVGLFDLRMPVADAVVAIEGIRSVDSEARIIILTTYDGDEDIYRALRSGAKGYILKDSTLEQITSCIRAVHAGRSYVPPPLAAKLAARVGSESLSTREIQVLQQAASGKPNKQIAAEIGITAATVKFHLNNVFSKLGVNSRTAAIAAAARRGLLKLD